MYQPLLLQSTSYARCRVLPFRCPWSLLEACASSLFGWQYFGVANAGSIRRLIYYENILTNDVRQIFLNFFTINLQMRKRKSLLDIELALRTYGLTNRLPQNSTNSSSFNSSLQLIKKVKSLSNTKILIDNYRFYQIFWNVCRSGRYLRWSTCWTLCSLLCLPRARNLSPGNFLIFFVNQHLYADFHTPGSHSHNEDIWESMTADIRLQTEKIDSLLPLKRRDRRPLCWTRTHQIIRTKVDLKSHPHTYPQNNRVSAP